MKVIRLLVTFASQTIPPTDTVAPLKPDPPIETISPNRNVVISGTTIIVAPVST